MDVRVVSREIIKPSSPTIHNKEPYKLCLFDQLTPTTYMSVVLFYTNNISNNNDTAKTLTHLKKSLSEILNLYYPFSGRTKDNLFVEDFGAGVPFLEAQIGIRISEYFELKDVESLNLLVPFKPLRKEASANTSPLFAFQANVFACGGLAIGTSFCHKVADGATTSNFLTSWAALSRDSLEHVRNPNLSSAASLFHPREGLSSELEQVWFAKEGEYVTRRFVFDAKAVETLIEKAGEGTGGIAPTRNEAVSCFVWERATEASRAVSGDRERVSVSVHAVNLRPRLGKLLVEGPPLDGATGNLMWYMVALSFDPSEESAGPEAVELGECAAQLRRAMESFDSELVGAVAGGEDGSSEVMRNLQDMVDLEREMGPDLLMFTNWKRFYCEVDFGWGMPFWVGPVGKVGPVLRDYVTLIESCQFPKGIEAFVYMEEAKMGVLERDQEFLKFASPNPDFAKPSDNGFI